MTIIELKNYNNKYFIIDYDKDVETTLRNYFKITEKDFDAVKNETTYSEIDVLEIKDDKILIPIPLAELVVNFLEERGFYVSASISYDDVPHFNIKEKWYDFLSEDYNGINQKLLLENITSVNHGVVQVPTGSGKSEMIVALADSYDDFGNILILAPKLSICEEIINRLKRENISVDFDFNLENKINVINPTGYCNSLKFSDEKYIKWMTEVGMIIIDECENITDSIASLLENQLIKYKYIYGFSASADRMDGKKLKDFQNLLNFVSTTYSVIKYVGLTIAFELPTKKLTYNIINSTFDNKRLPFNNYSMEYIMSLNNVIKSKNFVKCMKLMLEHKKEILYIPIFSWKHGEYLYDLIKNLGYNPVLWRAGTIKHEPDTEIVSNEYLDLKKYCLDPEYGKSKKKIDALLSTSVGTLGIDINKISDVYLYIGTKFSSVSQPIGRAFRYPEPSVWITYETAEKNDFFRRCNWRRIGIIRKTYKYEQNTYTI